MSTRHVLIVDDLHDIRQMLRSSLETLKLDINIVDVPSGEEAMLVISRQRYDLLVSDVRLAGISGLDLVRKARKGNPSLKVILITGMTDSDIRQQVVEFGADRYFFKPIDLIEFQKSVTGFLGFDSFKLPEMPVVRSEPLPVVMSLPDRLAGLRHELEADCLLVADLSGKIVVRSGELPKGWELADWQSRLSAASDSMLEVARALKREFPQNYLYISGFEYDLLAVSLGWMHVLLAAIPQGRQAAHAPSTQDLFHRSVQIFTDLAEFLAATAQGSSQVENRPAGGMPVEVVDTGQLLQVFQQAGERKIDAQEIDKFWEALADQQESRERPDAGSLSYEQARKLGLTPDE